MPTPSTAEEFLALISRSGLLEPARLKAYLQRRRDAGALSDGPRALADRMVRDGLLTRYQVEQLLRGKWRNFLLSGKYRVLGPLGSGGMGQVYLCEHQVMRRRVAVKVLPDRSAGPVALERFHREARAVAQLHHPNIVSGHDIDRDGKLHFLVMEYIDGSTFLGLVKKCGPMDPVRAAHYIRQAAAGLQHAHEAGLVHRDIKPSNLLLDRSGTVKILDLGLVRFFYDEADDLTRRHAESPVGTLDYMAPEQALDSHHADIRSDIYGLGATFYFLLAGHGPFRGGTSLQKLISHQYQRPRPIRELRPEVPAGLAAVVERMMAKAPAERYQTPAEVVAALEPWVRTPIPPPPPEEMPDVVAPAADVGEPVAGPALPASLYGPASAPTPAPGRDAETARSRAEPPTAPHPGVVIEPHAPPTAAPGLRPADAAPPAPERRRRRLAVVAAALVLGAAAVAFAVHQMTAARGPAPAAPAAGAPAPLRLLVPAYIYPTGEGVGQWDRIIDSPAASATVVIVNTDSGPGQAADANYVSTLERARRRSVTVIGYVSTKYAARPLHDVKQDVDRWLHFYPSTQGIFFDEQASSAEQVQYYAALYEYVRKEKGLSLVVTNPGTECAEDYLARPATDVVCLVEAPRGFSTYRHPAWTDHYPAERFAALLCTVSTAEQMRRVVGEMRDNRIGYGFVTDADAPNPWGRLPRYWDAEVEAVKGTAY